MNKKYKFKYYSNQSGMTLVEMLVVIAIFMIVSSIVIFDYGKFRSTASLNNLSDDIALSIRKVQNYAIGVKSSRSGNFDYGYGIYFTTETYGPLNITRRGEEPVKQIVTPKKDFFIFSDLNKNKRYDNTSDSTSCSLTNNPNNECIEKLTINTNDYIDQICAVTTSGGLNFGWNTTPCSTNAVTHISFVRPNPDAFIYYCDGYETFCYTASSVSILIRNKENKNSLRTIFISNLGQISIN